MNLQLSTLLTLAVLASTASAGLDSTGPSAIYLVDLNGDELLDRLENRTDGTLVLSLGLGRRQFEQVQRELSRALIRDFVAADLNGDSFTDLYLITAHANLALVGDGQGLFADVTDEIGLHSSVAGGFRNETNGYNSSVSGGRLNTANGNAASVSGGFMNIAYSSRSSISGGGFNETTGSFASISGGYSNSASGLYASVAGGRYNHAFGFWSSVSGGRFNSAIGSSSAVSGGRSNRSSGDDSSVSGGYNRNAYGVNDWKAGALFQDN